MHPGLFEAIYGVEQRPKRYSRSNAMSQTAAARTSQASAPSLRDRLKDPSLLRDRCYIDGAWTGTPAHPVTNPVNGAELAKVPKMSTAEATQAVEAAERAFPAWAKLTAKQRSNTLRKWVDLIIANREDLALILTSEQGKPLAEALGEVDIGGAYVRSDTAFQHFTQMVRSDHRKSRGPRADSDARTGQAAGRGARRGRHRRRLC